MNMINLDMYTMCQMRNYRLRVKFHDWPLCGVCHITVRTTLFDAIEAYTYTTEDIEKCGSSELIRQSISKFVETHDRELFTAIYNDETASLSQGIRDIIQRLKLHYKISYTIHGRDCIVWTDLFEYKKTFNYMVTRSNRVMTNAKIIEDSIRIFYNYYADTWDTIVTLFKDYGLHIRWSSTSGIVVSSDRSRVTANFKIDDPNHIPDIRNALESYVDRILNPKNQRFLIPMPLGKAIRFINIPTHTNKEETNMKNEKNVMEELSSWMAAYGNRDRECRDLSEKLLQKTSENSALKKTSKMLKDAISKRDEELRNLIKKNESLAEDINMYQQCLVKTTDENEKLKDEIQTRMNNENLGRVRIADLEDTVKMLREKIGRKDTAIQNDAAAFRSVINELETERTALNKENIRLCKKRLNEVYGTNYIMRDEEMIYPKIARILAKNGEHFTTDRDFILWNIVRAALDGKTHHTFCAELSMDTITSLMALGYDVTYNSTDHGTTIDISWEEGDNGKS